MRDFIRLTWKEARELLRPRYLLPILMVPLIFVALGQGVGGLEDELSEKPKIGVVNQDDGKYSQTVVETLEANADIVYSSTDSVEEEEALEKTREQGGKTLIIIPDGFSDDVSSNRKAELKINTVVESASIMSLSSSAKVGSLIEASNRRITMEVTGATPTNLDPTQLEHTTYIRGKKLDIAPTQLSGLFSTRFIFVPIIIMLVILVSGQMVINSMGIEKENKTLETLLTMPVKRRTIVAAKLVGSTSIGLIAAAIYTAAIFYYQSSISFGSVGSELSLGNVDYLLIGVSLAFSLVGVLALALCLGIFARDRQGAQLLLFPLSILAIIPMFLTMFLDLSSLSLPLRTLVFAIPFTHPIIAPKQLMFGDTGLVLAGIGYNVVFALAAVALAVRLFNSDRLVTGSSGRLGQLLSRVQR